jgi:hypothetical protein
MTRRLVFTPLLAKLTTLAALAAASGGLACSKTNPYDPKNEAQKPSGPPPKVEGVHPDLFDCKKYLSESEVASIANLEVRWVEPDMVPTPGTPPACIYAQTAEPQPDAGFKVWQVSLDCRPVAIPDANRTLDDLKAQAQPDFKELAVGRRAADHLNARLITIDDDTDCVAYVVGPDPVSREALARLALAKLSRANMPRPPRAVK